MSKMQSISESLSHLMNEHAEVINEYELCLKCNKEYGKSHIKYKRNFGPYKKGEVVTQIKECDCGFAAEALRNEKKNKIAKIVSFCQYNHALEIASFENFEADGRDKYYQNTAFDFIRAVTGHEDGDCFYLWGDTGVGKSHLAMAIHKMLLEKDYISLFLNVTQLFDLFKQSYQKDSFFHESDIMNAIKVCDMLILDDIGVIDETDFEKNKLYSVLNIRQGKSVIYTSNLKPDELKNRYGKATGSRFFEGLTEENVFNLVSLSPYRERGMK